MIFGKIEYLNLLPFHVFMKRFTKGSQQRLTMEYKKDVPARVNADFLRRRVDAAFISSIKAQKSNHVNLGIIAKKDVRSVLVIPNRASKRDKASASSNLLATILGIEGEVIIGDKALRYALKNSDYIDLAKIWHEKYNLPFVFALLCYHKDKKLYKKIEKEFLKREVKIPQYLLKEAEKRTHVEVKEIQNYLKLISYRVDYKAQKALKKFYKEEKALRFSI
ncbi:Menaquinone via 6-amino-6-deoxyfutalosine step 1 [hydrothermal vent metagenome]|uniref:Menaquinone via 6-amino-6-deoxyfutalosine step 1 n=1 Tax=hydrothermal vent metagenome TaxID=652676 RepID=A0A1W1CL50_9ZZZZ